MKLLPLFIAAAWLGAGVAGCAKVYRVPSSSMEPTLHCARPAAGCRGDADDRFTVQQVAPRKLRRGDIVLFQTPPAARLRCGAGGKYVKRVIGLPGERIKLAQNGRLWVDGRRVAERYLPARHPAGYVGPARWHVPRRSLLLLGDNRVNSCDSRIFGAVPFRDVLGRVTTVRRDGRQIRVH